MLKLSKFITISIISVAIIVLVFYFYLLSAVADESGDKSFSIIRGNSISDIALSLKEKNLIRSEMAFKIYSFFTGSAHVLKPGDYVLKSSLSTSEIIKRLVNGPIDLEVLVVEGKSMRDIENQLVLLGLVNKDELVNFPVSELVDEYSFLKNRENLEGFLFPDTYKILPDTSLNVIVEKLLDNFKEKALPLLRKGSNDFNYDDLIIASLIEREVPFTKDRRLVSGVLWKRFKIGMPLQIDATVVYVKCGKSYEGCIPLTRKDFGVKSLYNTYYYKGLPPTPIANPGLDAISAALNPDVSDFLYYLSDPKTKKTYFSKTLEAHNKKRARYLHL